MSMASGTKIGERREKIRKQYWAHEDAWTGEGETGWFRATRTLPLILTLLRSKTISGKTDPSSVYVELLARHVGQGVIEMTHESDHAYAAGYIGPRAVRTWQERMRVLEKTGFIKTVPVGNQQYRFVFLVHPTVAVQRLRDAGKVSDPWWNAYNARKIETKEPTYEQREKKKKAAAKVVPLRTARTAGGRKAANI
jgi:hypothetical protein